MPSDASTQIILNGAVTADTWHIIGIEDDIPATGDALIHLELWASNGETIAKREGKSGLLLPGTAELEDVEPVLQNIVSTLGEDAVVAIDFPVFTDGRGYSLARLLRSRLQYTGELRAVGDVLKDQLFYMQRCGFNSFAVRADRSIEDALTSLQDFSVAYQADVQQPKPIYHRRPDA